MKYALSDFTLGIELLMRHPFRAVTVFCHPKDPLTRRIRVSRKKYRHSRIETRPANTESSRFHTDGEFVITYGKPNYQEREFLALCKKTKVTPRKWKGWK